MGIQRPTTYGASNDIVRHLRNLTPNNYVVKKARVKASDIETLTPYEFERNKLRNSHRSIVKEK